VKVVTIYAFSIENFKRSKYEVDALMDMAKVKLSQLAQHGELLDRYGASIRILGQRNLVKPDVLEGMDEAVNLTKYNKMYGMTLVRSSILLTMSCRAVLNVCFPYTSRDEITTAIRTTVAEYSEPLHSHASKRPFSESRIARNIWSRQLHTLAEESSSRSSTPEPCPTDTTSTNHEESTSTSPFSSSTTLTRDSSPTNSVPDSPSLSSIADTILPDPETINTDTLTSHMFTAGTPPLDLLIRTSGVERLSDFMLWQCHEHTSIVFLKCLWPEFGLWHFLPVLVEWQWWRRKEVERSSRDGSPSPRLKTA